MSGKGEYDLLCIVFVLTVGLSSSSELFGFFIEEFSRHSRHSKENTHFHWGKLKERKNSPLVPLRPPLHLRQSIQ